MSERTENPQQDHPHQDETPSPESEERPVAAAVTPTFQTPLPIRLFLVVAAIFLFKMVYDISEQNRTQQKAIVQLSKKVDKAIATAEENRRGIERLNGGFSDIVKGVGRMGTDLSKSSRNVQMIQNDVHEEMASIRKKVNDISNRLIALQQELRSPFRR